MPSSSTWQKENKLNQKTEKGGKEIKIRLSNDKHVLSSGRKAIKSRRVFQGAFKGENSRRRDLEGELIPKLGAMTENALTPMRDENKRVTRR